MSIDLHVHSTCSDGTDPPEALPHLGEAAGLGALALTDHDTLDGLPAFLAQQPEVSVRLIPGIELSCRWLGHELHLLGLFLDPLHRGLQARVQDLRRRREERNAHMLRRLNDLGLGVTYEEVRRHATSDLLSRAHFAKALVGRGLVHTREDAFRRYLGDGRPGHVPFRELEPQDAAAWIAEAGGVTVVAHPGRFPIRHFRWEEAFPALRVLGIAGFEAYYSDYSPTEQSYFVHLAGRLGMARSGGSDYHGAYKPGISLGRGRGGLVVPDAILAELEALRPARAR